MENEIKLYINVALGIGLGALLIWKPMIFSRAMPWGKPAFPEKDFKRFARAIGCFMLVLGVYGLIVALSVTR